MEGVAEVKIGVLVVLLEVKAKLEVEKRIQGRPTPEILRSDRKDLRCWSAL